MKTRALIACAAAVVCAAAAAWAATYYQTVLTTPATGTNGVAVGAVCTTLATTNIYPNVDSAGVTNSLVTNTVSVTSAAIVGTIGREIVSLNGSGTVQLVDQDGTALLSLVFTTSNTVTTNLPLLAYKPYLVVTNAASNLTATATLTFQQ